MQEARKSFKIVLVLLYCTVLYAVSRLSMFSVSKKVQNAQRVRVRDGGVRSK